LRLSNKDNNESSYPYGYDYEKKEKQYKENTGLERTRSVEFWATQRT
jgi:hypothetical protein